MASYRSSTDISSPDRRLASSETEEEEEEEEGERGEGGRSTYNT